LCVYLFRHPDTVLENSTTPADLSKIDICRENLCLRTVSCNIFDDGLELCLLIKNFDTETPILFFTGTGSMTKEQALTIGAQDLVRKGKASFTDEL
jgi:CheY-like chemotaxis protein